MAKEQTVDKSATKLKTPEFRVSYPSVFKTKYNELADKEEFVVQALFPKDGTDLTGFKNAIKAAIAQKWPKGLEKKTKEMVSKNYPIKDGDEMDKPETAGMWVMNFKANENYQPAVVSTKKDPETGEFVKLTSEREFYGGCWARAMINVYAYEAKTQKGAVANAGVSFGLGNIQKLRDDEKFGGMNFNPEEDFADRVDESDDDESGAELEF